MPAAAAGVFELVSAVVVGLLHPLKLANEFKPVNNAAAQRKLLRQKCGIT
ncbi:MAG: hypothetical protein NVSMB58_34170 [Terriglobales bacterium]